MFKDRFFKISDCLQGYFSCEIQNQSYYKIEKNKNSSNQDENIENKIFFNKKIDSKSIKKTDVKWFILTMILNNWEKFSL